jgi:hypothetical protein
MPKTNFQSCYNGNTKAPEANTESSVTEPTEERYVTSIQTTLLSAGFCLRPGCFFCEEMNKRTTADILVEAPSTDEDLKNQS